MNMCVFFGERRATDLMWSFPTGVPLVVTPLQSAFTHSLYWLFVLFPAGVAPSQSQRLNSRISHLRNEWKLNISQFRWKSCIVVPLLICHNWEPHFGAAGIFISFFFLFFLFFSPPQDSMKVPNFRRPHTHSANLSVATFEKLPDGRRRAY